MKSLVLYKRLPYLVALFSFLLVSPAAFGQQKANFELAERFTEDKMEDMVGSTTVFPRWIEGEDRFWYTFENSEGTFWYFVDAGERSKRPLFNRMDLAAQLSETFNRTFDHKNLDLNNFNYDEDKSLFTFNVDSIEFRYNVDNDELIKGDSLKEEKRERWATYSPDSTWIAFAKNHDLYLMRKDDPDSTEYQLTTSGERWYSFQADGSDTTSDKRLRSAARWFEDSQKLWVKRQDLRKVEELWVINSLGERPELETYKYAMPGEEHVAQDEIWAFDVDTKEGVKLDTDKPEWEDETLGGVYFNNGGIYETNSSDYLYILRRNREWNEIDVLKANTSTGETEVLFTEKSKPYFNTRFSELAIINEGEEYIWWSERTGWGQLYLYDNEGNLKNRITQGHFVVGDIVKIDTTARTIYYEGFGKEEGVNPYYSMLYKVNFDGSGQERLTPEDANHQVFASEDENYFVDNYSKVDMPTRTVLRDAEGRAVLDLEQVDLGRLKEAGWKAPESFSVKAADNATDLYGVMWKPFDFDSTKKYPVIAYVYPGPQTEPFPTSFRLDDQQTLAQLGFIVVAMGQRGGSPIRSKYYHNFGYGNLRDYPLADNKYGLEQLAARHRFIDISKVGIYGHSGGGFMSTAALLTYPKFYDVAVSSAGNHDNNVYNIWWSEVHNGVEKTTKTIKVENEKGEKVDSTVTDYKARVDANPSLAENLQGHLLLVHGDMDSNVHPANSIRMADALIRAGKRFDFMIMPGKRHGFGNYSDYFEKIRMYYFAEHLLGDYRDTVNLNLPED